MKSTLTSGNEQLSSILPPSQRLRMLLSLVGDEPTWQSLGNESIDVDVMMLLSVLSQTFFDFSLGRFVAGSKFLATQDLPGAVGTMGPGLKLDQWKKPKFYNCPSALLLFSAHVHILFRYLTLLLSL